MLSVLFLFGLLGGWQYRTTVAQMNQLQSAFDAAGRGEYAHDLTLSGGDEWKDITTGFTDLLDELAERELVLERRRQRLDVLNRVLRHNLRNDLGVVLGYAEMLTDEEPVDSRRIGGIIHEQATELAEIGETARKTQQLMVDGTPQTEIVDIGRALLEIVDQFRQWYPTVAFEVDASAGTYVTANPQITAALEQLCENACEHNDADQPRVSVVLSSGDRREFA